MENKYMNRKSIGLPGGPNEVFTYTTGVFSSEGYKRNSPDVSNPFNVINSGNITMQDVDFPVKGTDNLGHSPDANRRRGSPVDDAAGPIQRPCRVGRRFRAFVFDQR